MGNTCMGTVPEDFELEFNAADKSIPVPQIFSPSISKAANPPKINSCTVFAVCRIELLSLS